jgi:hypothetical protein
MMCPHHRIHEFLSQRRVIHRIRHNLAGFRSVSAWHTFPLFRSPTLGPLRTILGTALLASADTGRIERSPHHVIAHPGKVLHAASADQHNRVLLQIVSYPRNISGYFNSVGKPHTSHLTQRRIRLLRSRGIHTRTNPTPLGTGLQCGTCSLITRRASPFAHELIERRQLTLQEKLVNLPGSKQTTLIPKPARVATSD